ncbi:hypothetical protein QQX98_011998 [Neonectria punicea]|uniref:Rhodopsin domain-containing protein n=1 Tax=Neonectria punicea TaxID=979145 RepID=A0ABR1GK47_9HYPO
MSNFTIEAFTLLGVGLAILGLRVYARIGAVGIRRLESDDYLMAVAAFLYSAETVLAYTVGAYWNGLANNSMTDEQRDALDPTSQEYLFRINGSKTQVTGWAVYVTLLWTLKAAMCAFYLRLTEGLDNYRSRIFAGFGLIFVSWVTVLLSILLGCRPLSNYWQINPDPGNSCQPAVSKINLFVTVVLNGLTDVYLLSIPVPMLWSVRLPMPKKLGLVALFSGGIFVITAGTLRCILVLTVESGERGRTGGLLGGARDVCGSSNDEPTSGLSLYPKKVISNPRIALIYSTIRRSSDKTRWQPASRIDTTG